MSKIEMIREIGNVVNNSDEEMGYVNAKQINAVISAYNNYIVKAIKNQETIRIANGLSLKGVPVEAHSRYCGLTGETLEVPNHVTPKLRVTKAFKEEMNGITW